MIAWQWFWDTPSWNWSYFWAGLALLIPSIAAGAYRLFGVGRNKLGDRGTKKNPRPVIDLVNGADGRWSTSKTTGLLWTGAVVFALFAILVHTAGAIGDVFGDFQAEYLLVLGIPIGSALAAKGITSAQVSSGEVTTKPRTAERESNPIEGVAQLFANDQGRADLLDTQYFLFNLVLLSWFLLTFFVQQLDQLPDLPDTLLGLTSVSALAYVTKKGLEGEGGPTIRSVVPAAAKPGDTVVLRGVNFATESDRQAAVLFNNVAGTGPDVELAVTYAKITVQVPAIEEGTVELRVVASDGRRSDPADFEVLHP
jgi:hypothetical protein